MILPLFVWKCPARLYAWCMVHVMNEMAGVGLYSAENVVSGREREREKDQPTDEGKRIQAEPGISPFKLSQNRPLSQQKLSSLSLPRT